MAKTEQGQRVPVEAVEATREMQAACVNAYLTVCHDLKAGMSELQIADAVKGELEKSGITDFWYDIPVMVLKDKARFTHMAYEKYWMKRPQQEETLEEGDVFYVDMHPRHKDGRWGNFAATGMFRPRLEQENLKQMMLLNAMQLMQLEVIGGLDSSSKGVEVAKRFGDKFAENNISLLDVRGNYGHSMESGEKSDSNRQFLDSDGKFKLGGQIFGIEPGGVVRGGKGEVLMVARFEDCVHIPTEGEVEILGRTNPVQTAFYNR